MEYIYKIVGTLCIFGYISGILVNITPTEKAGKAVRFACVLIVLSAVLSHSMEAELNIDTPVTTDITYIKRQSEEYIIQKAESEVESILVKRLLSKNISYSSLSVHIYKENSNISVKQVSVYGLDNDERQTVKNLFSDVVPEDKIIFGD